MLFSVFFLAIGFKKDLLITTTKNKLGGEVDGLNNLVLVVCFG